jgi:hypothetical protein
MIRRFTIAIAILLFMSTAFSQEVIVGLQYNEAVKQEAQKIANPNKAQKTQLNQNESVVLPFFDDFSTSNIYPDTLKWKQSNSVFVNKDFPKFPPTIGAATFDAIDSLGNVYPDAVWIPFKADAMTSAPIRLDSIFNPVAKALTPADSLYLSFYYQPQGNGDNPEASDSLILEFARKGDSVFQYVDSTYQVSVQYFLNNEDDTLKPGDTLHPPADLGCDTSITWINLATYTWNDLISIPCDSVFAPETTWETKWYAEGMKLDSFYKYNGDKYFAQVMVPIYDSLADTGYFNDAFQFRFRNYASITTDMYQGQRSNVDQWNIDYVYLNYNRSKTDTAYRVLAFSNRAPSFLKNYQSMPYRQYRADATNAVRTDFGMDISNLDKIAHNSNYRYQVEQVNGDFSYSFDGGNFNVSPGYYTNVEYVQKLFNFDFDKDTTSYIIKHYISDSSESNILVDSAIYNQGFYNYFAYDDGTPEFGYGISPVGAKVAYQFKLSMPDTLQGVQIYFNKTKDNANSVYFNLLVWKDNNGKPGEVVYELKSQKPVWEDGLYRFHSYMFNEPIVLSGTFYVGWEKLNQPIINVGVDANNYYGYPRIFYNLDQAWLPSELEGSFLIRPIVGSDMKLSIPDISAGNKNKLLVYPNPAINSFSIELPQDPIRQPIDLSIVNLFGSVVYQTSSGNIKNIDISQLPMGIYIIKVTAGAEMFTGKLLIKN